MDSVTPLAAMSCWSNGAQSTSLKMNSVYTGCSVDWSIESWTVEQAKLRAYNELQRSPPWIVSKCLHFALQLFIHLNADISTVASLICGIDSCKMSSVAGPLVYSWHLVEAAAFNCSSRSWCMLGLRALRVACAWVCAWNAKSIWLRQPPRTRPRGTG